MAVEHELQMLASDGEFRKEALQDRIKRKLSRRNVLLAHQRLFFEPDGTLKQDARLVLNDWAAAARIGHSALPASDAELRGREGLRTLFLHIIARLDMDGDELRKISRELKDVR